MKAKRQKISSLTLLVTTYFDTAWDKVSLLGCKCTLLSHENLQEETIPADCSRYYKNKCCVLVVIDTLLKGTEGPLLVVWQSLESSAASWEPRSGTLLRGCHSLWRAWTTLHCLSFMWAWMMLQATHGQNQGGGCPLKGGHWEGRFSEHLLCFSLSC